MLSPALGFNVLLTDSRGWSWRLFTIGSFFYQLSTALLMSLQPHRWLKMNPKDSRGVSWRAPRTMPRISDFFFFYDGYHYCSYFLPQAVPSVLQTLLTFPPLPVATKAPPDEWSGSRADSLPLRWPAFSIAWKDDHWTNNANDRPQLLCLPPFLNQNYSVVVCVACWHRLQIHWGPKEQSNRGRRVAAVR